MARPQFPPMKEVTLMRHSDDRFRPNQDSPRFQRRFALVCLALCSAFAADQTRTVEAQQSPVKLTSPAVKPNQLRQITAQAVPAFAPVTSLENTFTLHSNPTATKTIYLDFDGHTTSGTAWGATIVTRPFSLDANPSFSNSELTIIQEVWQRVAECFSPFNVDVTTEDPPAGDLSNSGGSDVRWGMRVCAGESNPSPAPGAGGVAFISSFSWNSDTPCFIFPAGLANNAKIMADASIHEVGHTLGLIHDGRTTPAEGYYYGHGSGPTGWAPHMGVGYDRNLVQWSKGEYASANERQDDLVIITTRNGFSYLPDDAVNDKTGANTINGRRGTGVNINAFTVNQKGVITQRTDSDWFKIVAGTGPLTLNAVGGSINTMLDIQMDLYSSSGTLITSSNPVDQLTASISQNLNPGTYYVKIDGVGKGDPLGTGYTDYSSLGTYVITGNFTLAPVNVPSTVIAAYNSSTKTLTLTGDVNANSLTVSYQAGALKVEGANGTSISVTGAGGKPVSAPSATFSHAGKLVLNADLKAGDDAIAIIGVDSSVTNISLGAGADKGAVTLSNIDNLNVDGGAGTDIFTATSSTIGTFTNSNLP